MIDYGFRDREDYNRLQQEIIINQWVHDRRHNLNPFDFTDYVARFNTSLISNYKELDQYYAWYKQ